MTNRSDEQMPACELRHRADDALDGLPRGHGLAAPTSTARSRRGRPSASSYTPNYPGVFMYHCGTPMVLEHIASGMYGMVIVEPREGYPTKVAREYAIVQSEFYARPDPQKRKVDGVPLYVLDSERVRAKAPTHTVFNGRTTGFVDQAARRQAGRARAHVRAERGTVQYLELPRRGHHLRSRVDGRQSRQPVPRHADGAAGFLVRRDRGVHRARGGRLRVRRPPLRQRVPGRGRHPRRERQGRGGHRAPQHPRHLGADRSAGGAGQAHLREQVPGLPLDRRRRQAGPGPLRRDAPSRTPRGSRAGSRTRTRCCKTDAHAKADARRSTRCRCRTRT